MATGEATERNDTGLPAISPPGFVGRHQELAALTDALSGQSAVVLIEGEVGIGKSRLLREYLATGQGRARHPLVACCPPFRQPHTLGPVADAIRQATSDVRGMGLSGLAGALRPLFPEWAADLPPAPEQAEDATVARHRLFAALAEMLDRLDVGLLVLEDAHWADEATLEFVLFLASRPVPLIRLMVTCRPEDVPAGSLLPRLSRLAAGAGGLRTMLGPLDVAATADLVSSMLSGEHVSEGFAAFVHQHTGGVPFAVEESIRLMATRADLSRRGDRWVRLRVEEIAVPPNIKDAVLERVTRLDPDAQEVLRAAAVLGDPTREETLAAVAAMAAGRTRAGLTGALASGLLAEDHWGQMSFRHVLACRAVYESMPGPHRRLLHERAGQALQALTPAPVTALARHFREAGDTQAWLRHGEQAADQALAVGDEATGSVLLYELVTEAGLPAATILRLASKMVLLALPGDDQLTSLTTALRGVLEGRDLEPADEASLRFQLARTLATMHEFDASRAELERAVAGLPPDSVQAVRAMMLLGWPQGSDCPAAEHLRWVRRAAGAEASVPPGERLRLLVDRATALLMLGEEDGWAEAARIPWEAATPRDRLQVIRAQINLGDSARDWGRYTEAKRRLQHAVALADAHHHARFHVWGLVALARLDWFTGAWDGLADRAAALAADDDLQTLDKVGAIQVAGLLRAATGASEQALQDLSVMTEEAGRRGAVEDMMEPMAALARLYLVQGDVTQALEVTEAAVDVVSRKGVWLWAADLAPARVTALTTAGRMTEAAALTGEFAAGLGDRDIPTASAGLALCRAILAEAGGEPAAAATLFARAAAVWQALPRPYDALLAQERQAGCLLTAGRAEAGLALLARVLRGLSALGAGGDAGRVARTLRQRGVPATRPRTGRPSYGGALSPRELAVVRLLAAGQTDAQIAQNLFVSPKTVAAHIISAKRKLNASTRAALTISAAQVGLLSGQPGGPGSAADRDATTGA